MNEVDEFIDDFSFLIDELAEYPDEEYVIVRDEKRVAVLISYERAQRLIEDLREK